MNELWARVGLVAAALVVAGLIALWQRERARSPIRQVASGDLEPGVYLFSSESCPTCAQARDDLDRALGQEFVEVRWEAQPELFTHLGVDAVPAVLIVKTPGTGRLFTGPPGKALAEL